MTTVLETLRTLRNPRACDEALEWVAAQPDQSPAALWATCRRGDWMLGYLEHSGVDVSDLGYVCAERARQSALRALPPSPGRDALAACAPIVDATTAAAAGVGAAAAAAWMFAAAAAGRGAAAAVASAAAAWASEAARERECEPEVALAAELAAIADIVRARHPSPPEVLL